jgi:hypothetical protein
MKPGNIKIILDLAVEARTKGEIFNPLFTGEAGIGKSAVVQQWVKEQRKKDPDFFFLDLRIAYFEAPDMIGFPEIITDAEGKPRTEHCVPNFWPTDSNTKGLILFEEPNRGTTGVMNTLMQVLTDRKVHNIKLPEGIIVAGCINPDSAEYDVNHMDAALRNRFVEFPIDFDHQSFQTYIEEQGWHEDIVSFCGSGIWIYKTTSELGAGATYVSPRSWERVNAALQADLKVDRNIHSIVVSSALGRDLGKEFHQFSFDQAPVTATDLIKDLKLSLKRLKEQSQPDTYKGDMIAATVESIIKHYGVDGEAVKEDQVGESIMVEVALIIPKDQAVNLIKGCAFKASKGNINKFFADFKNRHPKLIDILRENVRATRVVDKKVSEK